MVAGYRAGKTAGFTASSRVLGGAAGDRISAAAYRDGFSRTHLNVYSFTGPDWDARLDTDSYSCADAHGAPDIHGDSDLYADSHEHPNLDSNAYPNAHEYADSDSHQYSVAHGHFNCNTHPNGDFNSSSHVDAGSDTDVGAGTNTAGRSTDKSRRQPRAGHAGRVERLNGGCRFRAYEIDHNTDGGQRHVRQLGPQKRRRCAT